MQGSIHTMCEFSYFKFVNRKCFSSKEIVTVDLTVPFSVLGEVKNNEQSATFLYLVHLVSPENRFLYQGEHPQRETQETEFSFK